MDPGFFEIFENSRYRDISGPGFRNPAGSEIGTVSRASLVATICLKRSNNSLKHLLQLKRRSNSNGPSLLWSEVKQLSIKTHYQDHFGDIFWNFIPFAVNIQCQLSKILYLNIVVTLIFTRIFDTTIWKPVIVSKFSIHNSLGFISIVVVSND